MKISIEVELSPCKEPSNRIRRFPIMTSYTSLDVLQANDDGLPTGVMQIPNPQSRIEISQSYSGIVYVQYGIGKNEQWFSTKRDSK